jgi:hypothetical protein
MSASGIRAARPKTIDPSSSAMKAGSRTTVMRTTTSATPAPAMNRSVAGSAGFTVGELIAKRRRLERAQSSQQHLDREIEEIREKI